MEENQVTDNVADNSTYEPEAEKMLSQAQENKIIQHEKSKAAAARRELEDRYQRELESARPTQASYQSTQSNQHTDKSQPVDVDAIYQQVQERFNKDMQEHVMKDQVNHVLNNLASKMEMGKSEYDDFDEVTKYFNPVIYPKLTVMLSNMDNAHDIMYELVNNPSKLVALDQLAEKNPEWAGAELAKIKASIIANKQAKANEEYYQVDPPLNHLRSSRISGSDDKKSIADLRNEPWLRG